ncbi:MAG: hypothetical protein LBF93_11560, partial [Zoogloeaceae bacterium]|nr:hypothetical protein [Zoogloeaceae bacterium]
ALGGGKLADIIMRGGLAALGVDISTNVGMREVFDPLGPFAHWRVRNQEDAEKILFSLMGPTVGQMQMWARGIDYFHRGDTLRGMENFMPRGLANLGRAARLSRAGIPASRGDDWLSPEEFSYGDALAASLGFRTLSEARAQEARNRAYDLKETWTASTARLKRRYTDAHRARDYEALREIREDWATLQAAKKKHGGKATPLSTLLKSPFEKK